MGNKSTDLFKYHPLNPAPRKYTCPMAATCPVPDNECLHRQEHFYSWKCNVECSHRDTFDKIADVCQEVK